ncbi:unnamed protein product [Prorocentrum cordatum]|uniref:Uncharacterized protein n=1 Tax=Prorocentrum cordatum TaxID=2364126 RepID=A0ABN9TLT3_9DINO|nr:unnamed protein product [Polarella glacialis]
MKASWPPEGLGEFTKEHISAECARCLAEKLGPPPTWPTAIGGKNPNAPIKLDSGFERNVDTTTIKADAGKVAAKAAAVEAVAPWLEEAGFAGDWWGTESRDPLSRFFTIEVNGSKVGLVDAAPFQVWRNRQQLKSFEQDKAEIRALMSDQGGVAPFARESLILQASLPEWEQEWGAPTGGCDRDASSVGVLGLRNTCSKVITAAADPDSVFFPDRLRSIVMSAEYNMVNEPGSRGVFLNNCYLGLHGPLEVLSRVAVFSLMQRKSAPDAVCSTDEREDVNLMECLLAAGVEQREEVRALAEKDCNRDGHWQSPEWEECTGPEAAFHPFKTVEEHTACLNRALAR